MSTGADRPLARHLIHVGYPKTGSTFLQHWFETHPELDYVEGGIAGWRGVRDIVRQSLDSSVSPWRVTSYEALSTPHRDAGVVTVDYDRMIEDNFIEGGERACETLGAFFPDATILIVTRGFRGMILSSYSQYVVTGGEGDLQQMIASAIVHNPWRYDEMIASYRKVFGAERVLVLPYELLRDRRDDFLSVLERRLGVAAHRPPIGRVNEALGPHILGAAPAVTRFLKRTPLPGRIRHRLLMAHLRGVRSRRLAPAWKMMAALMGCNPVGPDLISAEKLQSFRGLASCLKDDPIYAPYAEEYLF